MVWIQMTWNFVIKNRFNSGAIDLVKDIFEIIDIVIVVSELPKSPVNLAV